MKNKNPVSQNITVFPKISQKRFIIQKVTASMQSFSLRFRSDELAGQSSTIISWSATQLLVVFALQAGAKSCWKGN